MPICKCGRNIPENATCFCSTKGTPVEAYFQLKDDIIQENSEIIENMGNKNASNTEYYIILWKELHTYKFENEADALKWFNSWFKRVPCAMCRMHFKDILRILPVDYSNKKAFFEWSVKAHNMVNKRLSKPEISLEEAILLWNFQDF